MAPMLELHDLRVGYGDVEVVHGIDLQLGEKEVVGIVGPNGAGKTSVLRSICGLVRPRDGDVRFEGRSLLGAAPETIARAGIGLVPEGRHIFKTLTVDENLDLGLNLGGEKEDLLTRVYGRFPILWERRKQRADRLSGGEQQQLALARALVGKPKLLILDEPSMGLAPKAIDTAYELLDGLRDEGMTMLLVEQNATRTMTFCDRCVVLSGGSVRAEGTREELQRDTGLLDAYLGARP
jgi:branched-chain amino acid transport system ATP-binding protein